ncbi:hypothetical protein [uncultured Bacteroides sp.]|jgi:hypothetical protein|uniref:hypothetical protein n=1 Tax=uncultured Bacteroides sp. TaxID=162156 RepID=UPI00267647E6|nr:hypothetical protein [uncultured Bacteroides sp.]
MQELILIFRTSIVDEQDIEKMKTLFIQYPQIHKCSVDFEDWEKILRIECCDINPITIISMLKEINIQAEILE